MIPPIDIANIRGEFQIENYFLNSEIKRLAIEHINTNYLENKAFTQFPKIRDKLKSEILKKFCDESTPVQLIGFKVLLDKLKEITEL